LDKLNKNKELSAYVNLFFILLLALGLVFSLNYEFITPPIDVIFSQVIALCFGLVLLLGFIFKKIRSLLALYLSLNFIYFMFFNSFVNSFNFFITILSLNIFLSFLTLRRSQAVLVSSFCILFITLNLFFNDVMWFEYSPYQYITNLLVLAVYSFGGYYIKSSLKKNSSILDVLSLRLKQESNLNEVIIRSIKSGVFIYDKEHKCRALNESARELIKNHPKLVKKMDVGLSNTDESLEFELDKKIFRFQYSPLEEGEKGEESDHIVLISDETDYVLKQKELETSKKLAAVGTLSAGLAHEIRNPLAGMSGSIELLKEGDNAPEINKKLFNSLLKEIDRLNLLVTDFLSFSVPTVVLKDKVNLKIFVSSILDELRFNPKAKGVEFDYSFDDFFVKVDEPKLKQVFLNILLNSVEAFDNDHVISLEKNELKPKISVKGTSLGHKYSLSIDDNGSGISELDLEKIFEPFHTTKDKGTGLGLALSHRILKEHKALVQVESTLGAGTRFHIEFQD